MGKTYLNLGSTEEEKIHIVWEQHEELVNYGSDFILGELSLWSDSTRQDVLTAVLIFTNAFLWYATTVADFSRTVMFNWFAPLLSL